MKNHSITAAALLAAAALALTGCSGTEQSQAQPEPAVTVTETVEAETPMAAEPTEHPTEHVTEPGTNEDYYPAGVVRSNPISQGEPGTLAHWQIVVTDTHINTDAQSEALGTPDDHVAITSTIEWTNTADENTGESPRKYATINYASSSGKTYTEEGFTDPNAGGWGDIGELYGGATESGTVQAFVPTDEVDGGVWVIEYHVPEEPSPHTLFVDGTPSN